MGYLMEEKDSDKKTYEKGLGQTRYTNQRWHPLLQLMKIDKQNKKQQTLAIKALTITLLLNLSNHELKQGSLVILDKV